MIQSQNLQLQLLHRHWCLPLEMFVNGELTATPCANDTIPNKNRGPLDLLTGPICLESCQGWEKWESSSDRKARPIFSVGILLLNFGHGYPSYHTRRWGGTYTQALKSQKEHDTRTRSRPLQLPSRQKEQQDVCIFKSPRQEVETVQKANNTLLFLATTINPPRHISQEDSLPILNSDLSIQWNSVGENKLFWGQVVLDSNLSVTTDQVRWPVQLTPGSTALLHDTYMIVTANSQGSGKLKTISHENESFN